MPAFPRPHTTDFDREVWCLLGLPFDALTLRQTMNAVQHAARTRTRCFITTPNLNYVISCRSDVALRGSVLRSDLSVPDGMPLIWAARLMGLPLTERVAGSSLIDALRRDVANRLSVYFFGGSDGVAAIASDALNATSGGLTCAGFHSPGFGSVADMSSAGVLAEIDRANADFLVVALPARKGQMWLLDNLARLEVPVAANLGAVINFVAGTITRAPLKWQQAGFEWLWRVKQEPQLWRRYLHDGAIFATLFFTQILPSAIAARLGRPSATAIASARVTRVIAAGVCRLSLSGGWTTQNLQPLRDAFRQAVAEALDIELDLGSVVHVDSAAIGLVMLLRGHQHTVGRRLIVGSCSRATRRQLNRSGAGYLLA